MNKKRTPTYYKYSEHKIKLSQIDSRSLSIAKKLKSAGHKAYIVGGAIRDILLNSTPKDFDIVTDISPEEIVQLFPSSYIIGRRFKLVHIRYKGHITEVSTFRAKNPNMRQIIKGVFNFRSDKYFYQNIYGSMEDDVMRRDLTINALYYDPIDGTLIDFAGGYPDIIDKRIRVVGVPTKRFKEDPMRILRIIRFSAKLDFKITAPMVKNIDQMKDKILTLPSSRIFEEFNKFFLTGYAYKSYRALLKHDCMKYLIAYDWHKLSDNDRMMIETTIKEADSRYAKQQYLAALFLLSMLLWPKYNDMIRKMGKASSMKNRNMRANHRKVCTLILQEQKESMAIPIKLAIRLDKIWRLQHDMESTANRNINEQNNDNNKNAVAQNHQRFVDNSNFKMAYGLMKARSFGRPALVKICDYWKEYAEKSSRIIAVKRQHKPSIRFRRKPRAH